MNPFTQAREKMGLSHNELAKQMNTTKETLINIEAGRYVRPPDWVIDFMVRKGADYLELTEGYDIFVKHTREGSFRFLGDPPYVTWSENPASQPFTKWRMIRGITIQDATRSLCISKESLRYFEQKAGRHQKTVPRALLEALHDCGYRRAERENLKNAYTRYLETIAS